MTDETRENLATQFAAVLKEIRGKKWKPFSEAAKETGLDPYVALARLMVRMVEDIAEPRTKQRRKPKPSDN